MFKIRDTHGLPFDVIFDELINQKNMAIDWLELVLSATKAGWKEEKIIGDIEYGLRDALIDRNFAEEIITRIKKFIKKESK